MANVCDRWCSGVVVGVDGVEELFRRWAGVESGVVELVVWVIWVVNWHKECICCNNCIVINEANEIQQCEREEVYDEEEDTMFVEYNFLLGSVRANNDEEQEFCLEVFDIVTIGVAFHGHHNKWEKVPTRNFEVGRGVNHALS